MNPFTRVTIGKKKNVFLEFVATNLKGRKAVLRRKMINKSMSQDEVAKIAIEFNQQMLHWYIPLNRSITKIDRSLSVELLSKESQEH